MTNKWTTVLGLIVIVSMFSIVPAFAQAGNLVAVELSNINFYWSNGNSIENTPLNWSHSWFTNMMNTPDNSGLPVINPRVEIKTNLNLVRFYPDDPSVFIAQPELGLYTWNFNGLELLEPEHLPIQAWTSEDTLIAKPRFTASRSVEPETLKNETTEQTVTLTFKLEEPLPSEVNNVVIHMGASEIAYEKYRLVEGQFVSMVPVADWNSWTDGVSAFWSTNPSNVVIGKTYTFQGTLKSVKSPLLLGSPIFKPGVKVGYDRHFDKPMVTGSSVTITDPNNIISANFRGDNIVDWNPFYSDNRFDFWFNPIVSQITPPPPPFHVLIPATVNIDPDTLNLMSGGKWITAYLELPADYDVNNINESKVKLTTPSGDTVLIDTNTPATVGDYNINGIPDLMVKFNRATLAGYLNGTVTDSKVALKVTGELLDGTQFEGTDTIRVIKKGK